MGMIPDYGRHYPPSRVAEESAHQWKGCCDLQSEKVLADHFKKNLDQVA